MNKLIILQLAAQATTYIDPTANDGVCWDFDKEKFAELIIRECADIATMKQHEWHSAGSYILEHFGVEK
jgi:hypothetical protein